MSGPVPIRPELAVPSVSRASEELNAASREQWRSIQQLFSMSAGGLRLENEAQSSTSFADREVSHSENSAEVMRSSLLGRIGLVAFSSLGLEEQKRLISKESASSRRILEDLEEDVQSPPQVSRESRQRLLTQVKEWFDEGAYGDLDLYNISEIPSWLLSRMSDLTGLTIRSSPNLQILGDLSDCLSLKRVTIKNCDAQTTVNLRNLPSLREFQIENCPHLDVGDIENCPRLMLVDLENCPSMTALDLSRCPAIRAVGIRNCSGLERLNLDGCPNLHTLTASGCPKLSGRLDLRERLALKAVQIQSSDLEQVDFSGCPALSDVELSNCPALVQIHLVGCTAVKNLSLMGDANLVSVSGLPQCRALQRANLTGCDNLERQTIHAWLQNLPPECDVKLPSTLRPSIPELGRQVEMVDLLHRYEASSQIPNADFEDFSRRALLPKEDPNSWEYQVVATLQQQGDKLNLEEKIRRFQAICDKIREAPPTQLFDPDLEKRKKQFLEFGYRINRLLERWSSPGDVADRAPFLDSQYAEELKEVCRTGWDGRIKQWEDDPFCPEPSRARGQLRGEIPPLLQAVELGRNWRRDIETSRTAPLIQQLISPGLEGVNVHTQAVCKNEFNELFALGYSREEAPRDSDVNHQIVEGYINSTPEFWYKWFWKFGEEPETFRLLIDQLKQTADSQPNKFYETIAPLIARYGEAAALHPQLALPSDAMSEAMHQAEELHANLQKAVVEKDGQTALEQLKAMDRIGFKISPPNTPRAEALAELNKLSKDNGINEGVRDELTQLLQKQSKMLLQLRHQQKPWGEEQDKEFLDLARRAWENHGKPPEMEKFRSLLQEQVDPDKSAFHQRVLNQAQEVLADWETRFAPIHETALRQAILKADDDGRTSLTDFGARVWLAATGQPIGPGVPDEERAILNWMAESPEAQGILKEALDELRRNFPAPGPS